MSRNLLVDFLAILVLIALHPAIFFLGETRAFFEPDSIKYMEFARDFLSDGLLYLEGGMSNAGNVLPPVYPALLLVGSIFSDDMLIVSEWVSRIAALASSVVLYLIVRKWSSQFFAFLAILVVQTNHDFLLFALTPLTESSFILVIACVLWLTLHVLCGERKVIYYVVLGTFLSLAFLTRQIGIVVAPFIFLLVFISARQAATKNLSAITIGMVLVLLPYMVTLQVQGSALQAELSPFDQGWSKRDVISIDDVDSNVQSYLQWLQSQPVNEYTDLIFKRRLMRQLLPDSSAMLDEVDMGPTKKETKGLHAQFAHAWSSLDQFPNRILSNGKYLMDSLGMFVSIAFVTLLGTPLLRKSEYEPPILNYLVGGFVLFYLLAISLLTGLIARYLLVLVPFILLHICVETYCLIRLFKDRFGAAPYAAFTYVVVLASYAYAQPNNITDIKLYSSNDFHASIREKSFQDYVSDREPILSILPFQAFVAGGSWRVMPNDSLEKITEYAAREGIPWLLIVQELRSEIVINKNVHQWYMDPHLGEQYGNLIEQRAVSSDGKAILFRFRDKQPELE